VARSFLTSINLNQNQLLSAVLQNASAAPSSPVAGQGYFNTSIGCAFIYNGTSWVTTDATKTSGIPTSAIAGFQSTIQAYSLSSFAAPTANIAMAGFTLTGLNTAPSAPGQAAEYSWVVGRNLNTIAAATANTANVPMGGFKLTGLSTSPTIAGDSAEYSWVLSRPLSVFAAPSANIAMAGFKLTGLATPSAPGDSAEYAWVNGRPLSTFTTPIANIAMGGYKLTGLPTPTTAGDSAEYSWVIAQIQSAAAGIASKPPVQVIATSNITLSGLQTLDGYTTLSGDRVLCVGQTAATANGVYNAASGAWSRVTDDGTAPGEMEPGAMWLAVNGTVNGATQWRCSNTATITIGTTNITIVQFGAASPYSAGNGISLAGSAFAVNPVSGGGIVVAAGGVSVDTTVVARKYSTTLGDGSTTSYVVTHNLGTQNVIMQVRQSATPYSGVECDVAATSATTSTITFATAPTTGQYTVTIIG
jgi:hypothetical protein